MEQNTTEHDTTRHLSLAQETAADVLASGGTVTAAARKAGRGRQQVSYWLHHDPLFQAEVRMLRNEIRADLMVSTANTLQAAARRVDEALDGANGTEIALQLIQVVGRHMTDTMALYPEERSTDDVLAENAELRRQLSECRCPKEEHVESELASRPSQTGEECEPADQMAPETLDGFDEREDAIYAAAQARCDRMRTQRFLEDFRASGRSLGVSDRAEEELFLLELTLSRAPRDEVQAMKDGTLPLPLSEDTLREYAMLPRRKGQQSLLDEWLEAFPLPEA